MIGSSRMCRAVVHHGGAGTTATGLRYGRPTVVVPFFADQPFWGERVHQLGCGPHPIPFTRLSIENLANAINRAVNDPTLRQNAEILGDKLKNENGVGKAVQLYPGILGEKHDNFPKSCLEIGNQCQG